MAQTYSSFDLFSQALYDKNHGSVVDFLRLYEQLLINKANDTSNEQYLLHANRIKQYTEEKTDRKYLSELRKNFNSIYTLIDKSYPDLKFRIDGREKAVVKMDQKIVKKINQNASLDSLRDTFAFRVTLFGKYSDPELVELCYQVMNSIIKHNNEIYTLCDPDYLPNSTELTSSKEIYIPKKSHINPLYQYGVKDYILYPKDNEYQSLHATFRRRKGGECFEIQVRTSTMHVRAESGNACHSKYKSKKYKSFSYDDIDKSKIHIPGFDIDENGTVLDLIGLFESLEILRRQKTF